MHTIRCEVVVSSTEEETTVGHKHYSVEVWSEDGEGTLEIGASCPEHDEGDMSIIIGGPTAVVSPADLISAVEDLCKARATAEVPS